MNKPAEYNRIRELINDWYEGSTDTATEIGIIDFFSEVKPEDLPEDLRREANVFNSFRLISVQNQDLSLLNEIEAEVKAENRASKLKIRRRLLITATTAAACLTLLIIVGLKQNSSTEIKSPTELIASANIVMPERYDSTASAHVSEPNINVGNADKTDALPISNLTTREATATTTDNEGYTHINNPDDVVKILKNAQKQYSQAIAKSANAVDCAGKAVDCAKSNLHTIITTFTKS